MKQEANKKSLRKQLTRFNFLGLCVIVLTVLFYIVLHFYTVHKYSSAFYQYRYLSDFSTSIENANGHVKEYLYTKEQLSFQQYDQEIAKAQEQIEKLTQSEMREQWRILLLGNMLRSYHEQANITKQVFDDDSMSYHDDYAKLLHDYELIKKTSKTYYKRLIDHMEEQNVMFDNMKGYMIFLSIFFASMLIGWIVYITRVVITSISDPLISILENISLIKQGSYDLTKIAHTNSELHALCEAMDDMAEAIQKDIQSTKEKAELEKKLLEKENDNLKKDELLAQSEVKMLQNQINPHFLFNTLNMTYRLALSEHAPKSSEMIERTSALLRYGLDKQNKMSDLQSEIKAVHNYIAIQETRLKERVKFHLQMDEHVPNIVIPGMIIQPLIENALKHGLCDFEECGEIDIIIRQLDDDVLIQVSDNGKGMDPDVCEKMVLRGFQDERGNHLGLYNVAKRLQMFYQDHVDISIDSDLECGFAFIIRIKVV